MRNYVKENIIKTGQPYLGKYMCNGVAEISLVNESLAFGKNFIRLLKIEKIIFDEINTNSYFCLPI